jgi:hypothetical protein
VTTVTVHPTVLSDSLAPPQIIERDAGVPRYGRAKPLRQVSAGRHKPLLTLRAHSRAARTGDSVAECGQRKACSYDRFAAVTPCLAFFVAAKNAILGIARIVPKQLWALGRAALRLHDRPFRASDSPPLVGSNGRMRHRTPNPACPAQSWKLAALPARSPVRLRPTCK